jgi:sugar phosphate isomerase/epimerase
LKAEELIGQIYISVPFRMLKEQYLDLVIEFGVNPEISFYADALETCSREDFKAVADRLLDAGRSVTFHATYLDLSAGSPDPLIREATRKRFEQVLDLAPLFRPRTVVSHVGFEKRRYHAIREKWLENAVDTFTWFARRLRDEGVRLMLENVFEEGPDDIRKLYERLDGLAGWCFDIGHQTAFSKTDMDGWMDGLGPFLGQLHLHDNRGGWDDHLAPGSGIIDFQALFDRLKDRKEDPPVVTIEPHNEPNVWESVEYLAKMWPW